MMEVFKPIRINPDKQEVVILDQRALPSREEWLHLTTVEEVFTAIKDMAVRGAPAIGIAAAGGMALAAAHVNGDFKQHMHEKAGLLKSARPTAVNLAWAVDRMLQVVDSIIDFEGKNRTATLFAEAIKIHEEDLNMNITMGRLGAQVLPEGVIMTHCNAGSLATGGYGTALGVLRAARDAGKDIKVVSCETRPYLQGARLTTWELLRDGFDVTLITDNMSGFMMAKGMIQAVIVGADRIAANGDTANKIGTYTHAVLANRHGIPFFVAAPWSTVDLNTKTGKHIVIEERSPNEVLYCGDTRMAPKGVRVFNPAFDVTPADLITAIITDRGVFKPSATGVDWKRPLFAEPFDPGTKRA